MTFRRNLLTTQAPLDPLNLDAQDQNRLKRLGAGAVRTFLTKKSWGYIHRSGQMALNAWNSLQEWLDSELIPKQSGKAGRKSKTPFKLDAILLEDRILYSASPLMVVAGSGESPEPSEIDTDGINLALDEIVLNLFEATGQTIDTSSNANAVSETISALTANQSANRNDNADQPSSGDDLYGNSIDGNVNLDGFASSLQHDVDLESIEQMPNHDQMYLDRIENQFVEVESYLSIAISQVRDSADGNSPSAQDWQQPSVFNTEFNNADEQIPLSILLYTTDVTHDSLSIPPSVNETHDGELDPHSSTIASDQSLDTDVIEEFNRTDFLWLETKRVRQSGFSGAPQQITVNDSTHQNLVADGDFRKCISTINLPGLCRFW